jgi:hypothetical protein
LIAVADLIPDRREEGARGRIGHLRDERKTGGRGACQQTAITTTVERGAALGAVCLAWFIQGCIARPAASPGLAIQRLDRFAGRSDDFVPSCKQRRRFLVNRRRIHSRLLI